MQNPIINFAEMYIFQQHMMKTRSRKWQNNPAGHVPFLFLAGQSFYFSNWYKTLFAVLEETKMKALK